jgi:hypothetical protein
MKTDSRGGPGGSQEFLEAECRRTKTGFKTCVGSAGTIRSLSLVLEMISAEALWS